MIQVIETTAVQGLTAMNEALVLGSVRQHELIEATQNLNAQLRAEIAEREQAEEALRATEARYSRVVRFESRGGLFLRCLGGH
jgi:H2-forming N5,N10-methylenetetrahydromethanopterin dehydrogenase-like enzyme